MFGGSLVRSSSVFLRISSFFLPSFRWSGFLSSHYFLSLSGTNRANYLFDAGLRFSRYTSGVRVCLGVFLLLFFWGVWREVVLAIEVLVSFFFKSMFTSKNWGNHIPISLPLGKWSNLTSIFFKLVGGNFNQPPSEWKLVTWMMKKKQWCSRCLGGNTLNGLHPPF